MLTSLLWVHDDCAFAQEYGQDLCFVTLPVQAACPDYRLQLNSEDLGALELSLAVQPRIGAEVLGLTIISVDESGDATANLLAPIVVNLQTQRARQCSQTESEYSHRQPLHRAAEELVCS